MAAAACKPGVSVARLAHENGINANMLFTWRR
ncbi:transposase [Paraburkholderia acidipaludis]